MFICDVSLGVATKAAVVLTLLGAVQTSANKLVKVPIKSTLRYASRLSTSIDDYDLQLSADRMRQASVRLSFIRTEQWHGVSEG